MQRLFSPCGEMPTGNGLGFGALGLGLRVWGLGFEDKIFGGGPKPYMVVSIFFSIIPK